MNTYVKQFFLRGLLFGGFGPIIAGIVFLVLSYTLADFSLTGPQVFLAILSTYLLAFVHAGASVFNQVEHWPVAKSTLFHFLALYAAYILCYLVNRWIPIKPLALLIFTAVFLLGYFTVWLTVLLVLRATERHLNAALQSK